MICIKNSAPPDSALMIMLVRIVSTATAIALLAHSLLGCCWHHEHSASAGHVACLHADANDDHDHADDPDLAATDSAESQHDYEDSDHRHRAPCVEPNCSFVGSDAPQLIDLPLIATAALTSDAAANAAAGPVAAGFAARTDRTTLSTARLRAVLQTWVV